MSAVSAEFSHAHANVAASSDHSGPADGSQDGEQETSDQARPQQRGPAGPLLTPNADFGPNEWLVDELYQRYQADPGSVDRAWWNFFAAPART